MKLNFPQLGTHLAKKLSAIYLISGDELLLKQDAMNMIRKAAKTAGFEERVRLNAESGFDWEQLYPLLNATSLLAQKCLIELNLSDVTPNKTASAILQAYAEKPSADNIVVISIGKADIKITKSAWYQTIEKTGIVVTIWPIPREQLPAWIIERVNKYKMQIDRASANLLADYVEGNLIAAAQAIEKIYLLQPTQPIHEELIHSVLTDESSFTVFDFVNALWMGEKARSLHILDQLRNEGIEPPLVLWSITRELRQLADLALKQKRGESLDQLFQTQRIFPRNQPAIRRYLSKASADDCRQALAHAAEIDSVIKGATAGDAWNALQLFCLRLV